MWQTASRPSCATPEPLPGVLQAAGAPAERREVLALIPARGGSKGLPRKNLALLCGLPLIAYTIRAALACRSISRVLVVTEDEEIAGVSRDFGADVPFLRPAELASDSSNLDDSFAFTLERLRGQGYAPDSVVFCFPTSPFRTPALMDRLVARLGRGHKAVLTARRVDRCGEYYRPDPESGLLRPVAPLRGALPCYKAYDIFSGYNLEPSPLGTYLHRVDDPVMCIDIDGPRDLQYAELVISSGLFDFGLEPR